MLKIIYNECCFSYSCFVCTALKRATGVEWLYTAILLAVPLLFLPGILWLSVDFLLFLGSNVLVLHLDEVLLSDMARRHDLASCLLPKVIYIVGIYTLEHAAHQLRPIANILVGAGKHFCHQFELI